jgi:hypothetical protein
MKRTFTATVIPAGNATGVQIPAEVVDALQSGKRPQVVITINGHVWRSRIASKGRSFLIGISAANRAASKIALNDEVEVTLELDTAPRDVTVPADLAGALDTDPRIREAFERLPFGLRRKHVTDIEASKQPETRERRIARLISALRSS